MNKTNTRILWSFLFTLYFFSLTSSYGQCPPASTSIGSGGPVVIGSGNTYIVAGSLYIGPGSHLTIDGNLRVFADTIIVDPAAIIDGNGTFHIASRLQSGVSGGCPAGPTYIDGNGAKMDVRLFNENPDNLVLADMGLKATSTNGQVTLYSGKGITFGTTYQNTFGTTVSGVDNNDIILNNYDVKFDNDAIASNYTPSRFFVTNGTGHVVREALATAFVFPVGRAEGDYTPASISSNAPASDFFVSVNDYATSASNEQSPSEGINRTWNIYASNVSATATVDLQHNQTTNGSSYTNGNAFVTRYVGTSPNTAGGATSQSLWDYTGNCSAGSGTGTLTNGSAISGASELTRTFTSFATTSASPNANYTKSKCDNSPLPVRLADFQGRWVEGKGNYLSWLTYQEQNNDRFEIQAGTDAKAFESTGRVVGKGTTSVAQFYEFIDAQPQAELTYYRLKQVDLDGQFSYSNVIAVRRGVEVVSRLIAYPNPVTDELYLQLTPNQTDSEVSIYDLSGRRLVQQFGRAQSVEVKSLVLGSYLVEVRTPEGEMLRQRFIKQ